MFAAIKNSKSTVQMLLNAKADATVANYVRASACATILALPIYSRSFISSRTDTLPNKWRVAKVITQLRKCYLKIRIKKVAFYFEVLFDEHAAN